MKRRLESPEQAAARIGSPAMTPGERALVWNRIRETHEGGTPKRVPRFAWGIGAAAVLAALALAVGLTIDRTPAGESSAARATCQLDSDARTLELPASCDAKPVRVEDDEWVLMPGAKVSRIDTGARVEAGGVEFRVRKRASADFRVLVSGGHQVRVIGTVFKIEQEGASGSVSVTEGVIEFTWQDGARERVAAGQTLFWPRRVSTRASASPAVESPPEPAAPPKSSSSTTPGASATTPKGAASGNLESVMDRVLLLKSQRRHAELIALLQKTLGSPEVSPVQRQRLSYELGLALEAAGKGGCDHWKRHARAYGSGAKGGALASKLERCKP